MGKKIWNSQISLACERENGVVVMKRDKDSLFVASAALPPREYVLLVSGTMNPPHAGHVRLGITAADGLCKMGHTVKAVYACGARQLPLQQGC